MRIVAVVFALMLAVSSMAQTKREMLRHRMDSVMTARRSKVTFDTAFIGRPQGKLTLKLRGNVSGNTIKTEGKILGVSSSSELSTDNKATLSVGAIYRGIAAGIALNPAKLSGRNKDYELNLNIYTNRMSLDVSYQMSKTLSGDFKSEDRVVHLERGMVDMKVLNLAGYYTFNHRRFSYPAAFTQSYIQKRSAGSWLAGFSFQGGRMENPRYEDLGIPQLRTYVGNFAIGGGYGYNFVGGKRWLLHLSAMPTLIVVNRNNITVDGERRKVGYHFPEMIFNEHMAIVYNISPRYFLATTVVFSISTYRSSAVQIIQNKWRSRACLGIRF